MERKGSQAAGNADLIIGRTVAGSYRIQRRIGEGGMGFVYLALNPDLPNQKLVVKILRAEAEGGSTVEAIKSVRQRFKQEAQIADMIGSDRVVRPVDVGEWPDGILYFAMEYVPGSDLKDLLKDTGPMRVDVALAIVSRVGDAMTIAHEKGIIHRDLKPANIRVSPKGADDFAVKLLDFGIARLAGETDGRVALTAERTIIGTPGYMSPEQAAAEVVDGRSDTFSLGLILYELLSGEAPFAANSAAASIVQVLTREPAPLSSVRPAHLDPVPPLVVEAINRALEKNAELRPTMAEFTKMLSAALNALGAPVASLLIPLDAQPHEMPVIETPERRAAALMGRYTESAPVQTAPGHGGRATTPPPRSAVIAANESGASAPATFSRRWAAAIVIAVSVFATMVVAGFVGSKLLRAPAAKTSSSAAMEPVATKKAASDDPVNAPRPYAVKPPMSPPDPTPVSGSAKPRDRHRVGHHTSSSTPSKPNRLMGDY